MKLVACFCLASGALLERVEGTLKDHDCGLFEKLLPRFNKGDIVLGDRAFGSYPNLASLIKRGADALMRGLSVWRLAPVFNRASPVPRSLRIWRGC